MKTIILLIVLLFNFQSAYSQFSNHVEFMGIPIVGNVDSFAKKLEKEGFTEDRRYDGSILMAGTFTNREVNLVLVHSKKTKNIYRVAVAYEVKSSWKSIADQYKYIVGLFSEKYGDQDMYKRDLSYDSDLILGFHLERNECYDIWELSNGFIWIEIKPISTGRLYISVIYEDNASVELLKRESMSDI